MNRFLKVELRREKMPKTMFQTLCRGINLFGYRPYPQNVIQISYFLNDALIGTSNQPPYVITFVPNARGISTLRAVAQTAGGTEISQISLVVQ